MFVLVQGGVVAYPYSIAQLRADNPDTSFPDVLPDERLAEWGVAPVVTTAVPAIGLDEDVVEGEPEQVDGQWRQTWVVTSVAEEVAEARLAALKAAAIARVNQEAGEFRCRFITDIPGQQATYLAKETEAKAWAPGADPVGFPYLVSEAAATAADLADVVALVLATAAEWRALDAGVEGLRRGACVAIASPGVTTAEAVAAAATVDWTVLTA